MLPQSILNVLPLEVVKLVLTESKESGAEYRKLRLVCKLLNDIVEPQVFSTASISFSQGSKDTVQDELMHLASGLSPYSRWAKTLIVSHLLPLQSDPSYGASPPDDFFVNLLACQTQWLIPAIKALKSVEKVDTRVDADGPCYDLLCALAELPCLRAVLMRFDGGEHPDLPLGLFSNLTSITLKYFPSDPSILEGAKKMIAQSLALTDLDLRAQISDPEGNPIKLETLLSESPSSSVKELTLAQRSVSLTSSCTPFLQSLTTLNIVDNTTLILPSFWKAMQDSHIRLEAIAVHPLTEPIIEYLSSYTGLRRMTLSWLRQVSQNDAKMREDLFFSVLPEHKDTLQVFIVEPPTLGPWCITEPHLKQLHMCKNLTKLEIMYYLPSPNEEILYPIVPLDHLFSSTSQNLPLLQRLELKIARKSQTDFDCSHGAKPYWDFARVINKTPFNIPSDNGREPRFSLRTTPYTEYKLVKDPQGPGRYRFKVDNPCFKKVAEMGIQTKTKTKTKTQI